MEVTIYGIIQCLTIYSFLGWCMESVFRSICEKKIINTGFLNGPFCPIYGIGALVITTFLKYFENNIIILFIASFIILSIWEYFVGALLEKTFNTKYWDYSNHKINIKGRVCLSNSIAWGVLGVLFVKYIHPFVTEKINLINPIILKSIVYTALTVIILDTIVSVIKIKNIKGTLEKIEKLNSEIKERLKELKKLSMEKIEIGEEKLEDYLIKDSDNLQIEKLIVKLRKKQKRKMLHLYKRVYRLKKAFPELDTNEIKEVLGKKIELKKLTEKVKTEIKEIKQKGKEIKINKKEGNTND